jgi:predicted nucleotidyltransferase
VSTAPILDRFHDAIRQSAYPYKPESIILAFEGGSVMHGASIGNDDHDYYAVFLEPPEVKLGLQPAEHYVWSTSDDTRKNTADDIDLVMYSLTKFARLAAGGNPTILHFLFVENALGNHAGWEEVRKNRGLFLAKSHLDKFIGYSDAQFDRLTGRRARRQFRPELIDKFGFDTKAAMHGMRLMYEALDLLRTGEMTFPNPHADYLIEVRSGKFSLDQVLADFERLKSECREAQAKSALPESADVEGVNRLIAKVYRGFWG